MANGAPARRGRQRLKRLLFALALASLPACGSGKDTSAFAGAPLDCAWLASENCWKTLVAQAASCVPKAGERGTLSADGSACTYASGTDVDFHVPAVLPLDSTTSPPWDFTQSLAGDECVSFDSSVADEFTLTVAGMTYREKTTSLALQVTCPDGTRYAAADGLELFNCSDYASDAPGHTWFPSDTAANFSLLTGHGDALTVFDCSR